MQSKVAEFIEEHDMDAEIEYRILDAVAELGEVASDAAKSADYGLKREELEVSENEIGDAVFSLLALSESLDVDAEQALETSLEKYRSRIEEKGDAGSR